MNTPTPTPRTRFECIKVVPIEVACDLENELADAIRERDEARGQLAHTEKNLEISMQQTKQAVQDRADEHVALIQQLDEARKQVENQKVRIGEFFAAIEKLNSERDEARGQLSAAKREAENLATSIYRAEYSNAAPNWELCDSVAEVIWQIANMYAGVRAQRDEARVEMIRWQSIAEGRGRTADEPYTQAEFEDATPEKTADCAVARVIRHPWKKEQTRNVYEFPVTRKIIIQADTDYPESCILAMAKRCHDEEIALDIVGGGYQMTLSSASSNS
jgi:F0F1-type ATP synthase membrane subunit b/b'